MCRMHADAQFELKVDVPFPLNLTPMGVIENAGNVGVQRVLTSLMDTLCASIVRDHASWAQNDRSLTDRSLPLGDAEGELAAV
jgi:hypothetical protein